MASTLIYEYEFYFVAAVAVLMAGISKSGFSSGGGMMAVPLMSLFVSPQIAAAIMLPLLIFIDVVNVWRYRGSFSSEHLVILLPGAMLGIVVGMFTWQYLNVATLRLGIGCLALFFVARHFLQLARKRPNGKLGKIAGFCLGSVSGLTSFVAHAGGPPVDAYVLSQKLDKTKIVATNVYFFFVVNLVKTVPYFFLGQFSAVNLKTSLVLAPLVPVGVLVGYFLHGKISQAAFMKIAYFFLTFAGFKLLYDGLTNF